MRKNVIRLLVAMALVVSGSLMPRVCGEQPNAGPLATGA